ncbi:hypothetical protein VN12_09440 [Pirellula sp. SH-Sr6A]|uniref:hypothetical protein n=1 Tax=Pirellula sp. SH-Sr6A TaxID=1632865 RepID=UPI00078EBD59|nr:hypothetical protein [Pirellula sp. SH-Sr6A]AMV32335.1 hypothetical protein VN12_09440 [Pirellula sp. SH-Sr6A]
MSTRCRHDLNGSITQLQSTLSRWREAKAVVLESWSDQTAAKFLEESLGGTEEVLTRMHAQLLEAAELVRSLEKRVQDTDESASW